MSAEQTENNPYQQAVFDGLNVLCRIFWGPDSDACSQMAEGNFFNPFEAIKAERTSFATDVFPDITAIPGQFASSDDLHSHLDECYIRLFVSSRDGIIPLYQSCYEYEDAPMMGEPARMMAGLFEKKGLSLTDSLNEPPDHLAIELEYLFFLLNEEAENKTAAKGNRSFPKEAVLFVSDTLLPWVTALHDRLKPVSSDCRFFLLAAGLLIDLLELIQKENG